MALTQEQASKLGKKSSRKGIANKSTNEIREAFQNLISLKLPELSGWIDEVATTNPEKALDIIVKYSEFVLPKLSRQEVKNEITIEGFLLMSESEREQKIIELEEELNIA